MQPLQDSWCTCTKQGICMGCMIEAAIREKLGTEGWDYLAEFIPMIALDKPVVNLIRTMGVSVKTARTAMAPKMGMNP